MTASLELDYMFCFLCFTQTSLDRLTVELTAEQDRLRAQQESESRVRSSEEHLQSQLKLRTEQVTLNSS